MVCKAAVKILDLRQHKEITIPCHRHCDAFQILKEFDYKFTDYIELAQGFLNERGEFMTRVEAWHEARKCRQFPPEYVDMYCDYGMPSGGLYSEDLW